MEAAKEREGDVEMARGGKCLKTGVFSRWKPDWCEASAHFEKAATLFRAARAMDKAMDAFARASEAHANLDSAFMAGKHLESAAIIARDIVKDQSKAATFFENASRVHLEAANVDAAAEALSKGGRAVEQQNPSRGCEMLIRACDLFDDVEEQNSRVNAVETIKTVCTALKQMQRSPHARASPLLQAVSYLIRTANEKTRGSQLRRAAELLEKQAALHAMLDSPHNVARCELSVVVVRLAADDFEGAIDSHERAVAIPGGYAASDDAFAATALFDAYASQNEEALKACTSNQIYNFLENQVSTYAATSCRDFTCCLLNHVPRPSV